MPNGRKIREQQKRKMHVVEASRDSGAIDLSENSINSEKRIHENSLPNVVRQQVKDEVAEDAKDNINKNMQKEGKNVKRSDDDASKDFTGTRYDSRPRLHRFFRSFHFVFSWPSTIIALMYGATGDPWYAYLCYITTIACSFSAFISIIADPVHRHYEDFFDLAHYFALIFGTFAGIVAGYCQQENPLISDLVEIVFHTIIRIALGLVYPILRKNIAKSDSLEQHMYEVIFAEGYASQAAVIYLLMEPLNCLLQNYDDIEESCGGLVYPSTAVSYFLWLIFYYKLYLTPSQTDSFTIKDVATLNVPRMTVVQLGLLSIHSLSALCLFALMAEGPVTTLMAVLLNCTSISLILTLLIEFAIIALRTFNPPPPKSGTEAPSKELEAKTGRPRKGTIEHTHALLGSS